MSNVVAVETQVPIVYDGDSQGFCGPINMDGPQIGMATYTDNDDLHVHLKLEYAQPNTKYEVFLVAGPSHDKAAGFRIIGTLATNATGAGKGVFSVFHATLLQKPFGPGSRTDHIDLLQNVGDTSRGCLTAGAINYFISKEKTIVGLSKEHLPESLRELKLVETLKGEPGKGDPLLQK